jgi:hypothetical protein
LHRSQEKGAYLTGDELIELDLNGKSGDGDEGGEMTLFLRFGVCAKRFGEIAFPDISRHKKAGVDLSKPAWFEHFHPLPQVVLTYW